MAMIGFYLDYTEDCEQQMSVDIAKRILLAIERGCPTLDHINRDVAATVDWLNLWGQFDIDGRMIVA